MARGVALLDLKARGAFGLGKKPEEGKNLQKTVLKENGNLMEEGSSLEQFKKEASVRKRLNKWGC